VTLSFWLAKFIDIMAQMVPDWLACADNKIRRLLYICKFWEREAYSSGCCWIEEKHG